MSHLILAVGSTRVGHDKFPLWLHKQFKQKYVKEDGVEATCSPHVREIRFYEVCMKRQAIPGLIDELSFWQKVDLMSGASFRRFYGFIRKFLPFEIPDVPDKIDTLPIEQIHNFRNTRWNMQKMGGPLYIQFLGVLPDMINEDGEDML